MGILGDVVFGTSEADDVVGDVGTVVEEVEVTVVTLDDGVVVDVTAGFAVD